MIILILTTLLFAAIAAEEEERPKFDCYHTHDINFNKDTASVHPNCDHCIYEETVDDGKVVAVSRMCVGKQCVSYEHVFDGYGQNRICCSGDLCNVDKDTASNHFAAEDAVE
ncbi:hypothetical protein CRM22_008375 [Opisthorchis felineus]|uniref:UPAR/Ly6 domain-containing protein n=1 Tax=Opisthorchis felineus TaxID=147828 RepID=A0A4S2LC03_OPIFE|nr:hypothetical protein CRM22_008375 [Opisthorchis felineus]